MALFTAVLAAFMVLCQANEVKTTEVHAAAVSPQADALSRFEYPTTTHDDVEFVMHAEPVATAQTAPVSITPATEEAAASYSAEACMNCIQQAAPSTGTLALMTTGFSPKR
jgi:hypothetical protein